MLKAYDYVDVEYGKSYGVCKIRNQELFQSELDIAERFAKEHPSVLCRSVDKCPICGKTDKVKLFYEKWNVKYYRCSLCYSVFANITKEDLDKYKDCENLNKIRVSKVFQEEATKRRTYIWNEFLEWLSFRSFRYFGRNKHLAVVDYGTRYQGFIDAIVGSELCGSYELRGSIIKYAENKITQADLVLCMDCLQGEHKPLDFLKQIKDILKDDGLLVLSTRVGSGFDIVALRENNENVYPYEHILLPSKEGLQCLLTRAGYKLLEITTPGEFDMNYVLENRAGIHENEYFLQYLLDTTDAFRTAEFQRFLQKNGMSSFARIIAKKVCKYDK